MKRIWLTIAGVVVIMASLLMVGCSSGSTAPVYINGQQVGLWVSGEGKQTVTPDLAIINIGIQTQEVTVADAQAKTAEAMDKLIAALKLQGVDEKDIQTASFSISQVTRWDNDKNESVVTGYSVSNTVTVKIRDIKKAGVTIDAAAAAGGDLIRVNGITFTVDDPTAAYNQARDKAIQNAMDKAKQIAEKSGAKLGKITYITESNSYYPVYRSYDSYKAEAVGAPGVVTHVSAGEQDVTTTVQISYAID
jgi:uncharacterized protein